jgi:hypothetical protein
MASPALRCGFSVEKRYITVVDASKISKIAATGRSVVSLRLNGGAGNQPVRIAD